MEYGVSNERRGRNLPKIELKWRQKKKDNKKQLLILFFSYHNT